ncbi:FAD binding domain-containing protein [bacterium]|nr:FAD binding domain-containing protein [bacterium]
MQIRNHLFPESVEEAVELLKKEKGKARLIAGGTDLVVEIRNGGHQFEVLVDIARIPGLDRIELEKSMLKLGPAVTMTQAETSDLIKKDATALAEGCSWVGGPQIRNRATIVGNIVSAQPAADAALPLFVLNAELKVLGEKGERTVKIEDSYIGVGQSAIDSTSEIITSVSFEKHSSGEVSVFKRMMRREALTLPVLNCAVFIRKKDNLFSEVRIALGPVASTPIRMKQAEGSLKGKEISSDSIMNAAHIVSDTASPRNSTFRGSGAYRKEMVRVIVIDAFKEALSRFNDKDDKNA